MTQFPSVFQSALHDAATQNNPHPMQLSPPQPMQMKPTSAFNQQMFDHGPNDFTASYGMQTAGICRQASQVAAPQQTMNPQLQPTYSNWYPNMTQRHQQQHHQQQQQQQQVCVPLPQNLVDQLRYCAGTSASPIFILPSGIVGGNQQIPTLPPPMYPPSCFPYPVPVPFVQSPGRDNGSKESSECKCSLKKSKNRESYEQWSQNSCEGMNNEMNRMSGFGSDGKADTFCENWTGHRCKENNEGVVCSKKNCPASIQLQAMVSQFLAIHGVISSAITRLLLKRIPGSNVNESIDEIMEKSKRCIRNFTKEQLLKESKTSQQINRLISLYLTSASTLPRLIPILTNAQLKSNLLRSFVESYVNARLMEDQGCIGTEAPEPLDELILQMKSDDELRQLLAALREKECEERVNLNFAAYGSQRRVTETRLVNVQKKINQVEKEMERRHRQAGEREMWRKSPGSDCDDDHDDDSRAHRMAMAEPKLIADNPVSSPKRLMLKPHVGSPETTYDKPNDVGSLGRDELAKETTPCGEAEMSLEIREKEDCEKYLVKVSTSDCFHIKLEDVDCCDEYRNEKSTCPDDSHEIN